MTVLADETRAPVSMSRGFFVGRRQEVAALRHSLEAALAGRGRLVMLSDKSGIGKTRTAREFVAVAEQHGPHILWGRCYENPGAPPFWPWVEVIRSYAREQAADRLFAEMGGGAADIAEALFISLNTVATHVRNILTKTNSANRTEAAAYAMSHGLTFHTPSGRRLG
jgi:hypothetical protein